MRKNSCLKILISALVCLLLFSSCTGGVVCRSGESVSNIPADPSTGIASFSDVYSYSAGGNTLMYDKKTTAVAVRSDSFRWQSLPSGGADAGMVFYLKAICGKKTYYLNSQSDCVAKGGAGFESTDGGVTVFYDVSSADGKFTVSLFLTYTLDGDRLEVSTDVSRWEITGGAVVADFCLLPYFGAVSYESAGLDLESDYFCVPDGPGAVVYTKKDGASDANLTFDVYSDNVTAPVFGVKQGNAAFACVTVRGDASMQIVCNTADRIKRIYNLYRLAVCTDGKNYVKAYDGEITAVYSFTSGGRLSFADIAAAARSVFIEYGFFTRTDGVNRTTVILGGEGNGDVPFTTEAQIMLGLAKGKGINGINLICRGILGEKNGLSFPSVENSLGGRKGLEELCDSAMLRGYRVYASAFVRTQSGSGGSLEDPSGDRPYFSSAAAAKRRFARPGAAEKCYESFFLKGITANCGLFAADASAELFSAKNHGNSSAGDQYEVFARACENLGEKYGMMSYGGYFMALRNSDGLVSVPLFCSRQQDDAYVAEPFIPAILHGYVLYTSSPVNMEEIPQLAVLRAVEYGCGPCVQWSVGEGDANYYETGLSESYDYLVTYSDMLSGIRGAEITDHYEITGGVYCTEYDGKTHVYVNYGNVSAVLGDIVIPPYDILVLN